MNSARLVGEPVVLLELPATPVKSTAVEPALERQSVRCSLSEGCSTHDSIQVLQIVHHGTFGTTALVRKRTTHRLQYFVDRGENESVPRAIELLQLMLDRLRRYEIGRTVL